MKRGREVVHFKAASGLMLCARVTWAEGMTTDPKLVTCKRCKRVLAARGRKR